ncbi:LysM peptidoglycan-binding domain-containing protein [Longirhabdus pacifica]|uniref:LysM peptidoglycan-binding domain-containing protein n=1 Tax=Longirhabdus pacifica TaxID=2305227 RepID=UPI001008A1EC|nr:LysM peptidoglycan-binding domain-containing protein [Longirhabdus pacifica]
MQIWLKQGDDNTAIQLPVNPASIQIKSSHTFNDVMLSQFGEFTVIGDKQLKEYSFSSLFPRDYNETFCEYVLLKNPWDIVATIESWQHAKEPITFIVSKEGAAAAEQINVDATIRDFSYEERAGSPGDVYFSMTLKEYKTLQFEAVVKNEQGDVELEEKRPTTKKVPSLYVVKRGDSLWLISQRTYGDGRQWRKIYNENKETVGPDPNLIYPGQKLVIPL